ncbi:MAG TPA: isocitrate dehydrogenase kinase/phosphatase AceK regulatory subunit [Steroidobacteraceae bacterium]|nr:isocitrate dehydrogenase kinase/phosphatase AceK regulatory subunit [Steroidobacteraceae bacterium]
MAAATPADSFAAQLSAAPADKERTRLVAARIFECFVSFYGAFQRLTQHAKTAFEVRDPAAAVTHARTRLGLYDDAVYALADELRLRYPALTEHEPLWAAVEETYRARAQDLYDGDLAIAFLHSVMRRVHVGEWRPVDYTFGDLPRLSAPREDVFTAVGCHWPLEPGVLDEVLKVGDLAVPYRDLDRDAARVAQRLNESFASDRTLELERIEMIRGCFFRNRGAYLVGRLVFRDGRVKPLVIALRNGDEGLVARAVLVAIPHVHNLFSSTQAAFHVMNPHYHEIAEFLFTIMPRRPLGLQYSTFGFYHYSKVAVMSEITQLLAQSGQVLSTAPGSPGTVAMAFNAPCLPYVLKVIRDRPTDGYKWGTFPGPAAVLDKYRRVHEINRTGSMLDNTIFNNLKLERAWFDPRLLEELVTAAGNAVRLQGDAVIFKYLVVQRTLMPLNIYLQVATPDKARRVISNLGHCIKNNAAANLFNRDFDIRNYGVTRYLKVYLYDFDAVEALTDMKVRTNTDRVEGEEGPPAWYFEEGFVFLPEEIEPGLRLAHRELRRAFHAEHGDLLTVRYWEDMQAAHRTGQVPGVRAYPESCYLEGEALVEAADE